MSSVADAVTRPLWIDQLDAPIVPRAALGEDLSVDVAIVGGGFSGLWTAYYLIRQDPGLRIAVLEREFCGFGASGRNGGWAIGELAASAARYASRSSEAAARRLTRAVFDAVDEIGRVCEREGIACDFAKDGAVRLARNKPQADRQRAEVETARAEGLTEDDVRLLSASEARACLDATGVRSAIFFAHAAAVDPAALVRGLAAVVEDAGVRIFEETAVTSVGQGALGTAGGSVSAEFVIRATEAYSASLPGHRRDLLPVYSLMIATEPLPGDLVSALGPRTRSVFADDRHLVIYGQRTADDRIAFGAPGVPYLFRSRISEANETNLASHEQIRRTMVDMLPMLADVAITHRWGGVLGIPRNWVPGLRLDDGEGVLGGYVGEGVAAANLAGRTMADLILGLDTDRSTLPWVGSVARTWEPEPFRYLGVRGSRLLLAAADRYETRTDSEAAMAFRFSRLLRGGTG